MGMEESADFIEKQSLEPHTETSNWSYKNLPEQAQGNFTIAEVREFQLNISEPFEELTNLFLLLSMPHSADMNSPLNIEIHLN